MTYGMKQARAEVLRAIKELERAERNFVLAKNALAFAMTRFDQEQADTEEACETCADHGGCDCDLRDQKNES